MDRKNQGIGADEYPSGTKAVAIHFFSPQMERYAALRSVSVPTFKFSVFDFHSFQAFVACENLGTSIVLDVTAQVAARRPYQ
ncbi:hypothetical protein [Hyphococcus sp. DH-69]|uniref:hypothetical protein n=1 Tax=Hyphococcus formosus TaxID=3143534 RepID=UPI00398A8CD8